MDTDGHLLERLNEMENGVLRNPEGRLAAKRIEHLMVLVDYQTERLRLAIEREEEAKHCVEKLTSRQEDYGEQEELSEAETIKSLVDRITGYKNNEHAVDNLSDYRRGVQDASEIAEACGAGSYIATMIRSLADPLVDRPSPRRSGMSPMRGGWSGRDA